MSETSDNTWRKVLLPANSTIGQAIHNLDESKMQIGLVVSEDGILLGTITDGDIRRGLLRGIDLNSTIDTIIHRDAFVVAPQIGRDMVTHLMRANKIRQLPVVDADRRVVGLHIWEELAMPLTRPNLMVIMAGGLGTRLRPHTENCPKPLLPVAGKPMLEHIIERAKAEGFSHFVLAVHYLGHMIEDYFGNGERWHVKIDYLREDAPLGTAGALGLLHPRPEIPFAVTNGDVLTDIRYGEILDFHASCGATATMAVRLHEWQHPFGVVITKGIDIVNFEEKPVSRTNVNAGIYVLAPSALDVLAPYEPCDMPSLFERLQKQGDRTVAYAMHELWLDVGRSEDLDHARNAGKVAKGNSKDRSAGFQETSICKKS
jgi:dTDP-glucose pyrophosphorylase